MKRFLVAFLAIACVAATHKKVQSPKDAELSSSLGAPMKTAVAPTRLSLIPGQSFTLPPPSTNFVYKKRFEWDYDPEFMPHVSTFTVYMGTNVGVYNWSVDTGTNLFYDFARTNWDERGHFHFVTVTARDEAYDESVPSNEVHFPNFGATHVRVTWLIHWETSTLFWANDIWAPLQNWNVAAVRYGDTNYTELIDFTGPPRFFYLDKPDTLSIELFNPKP